MRFAESPLPADFQSRFELAAQAVRRVLGLVRLAEVEHVAQCDDRDNNRWASDIAEKNRDCISDQSIRTSGLATGERRERRSDAQQEMNRFALADSGAKKLVQT
jgi:hypothetical protein